MKKLLVLTALMTTLLSATFAQATLINFDDVTDGTVINSHYTGVTFDNPLGPADIYARSSNYAASLPNVVSVLQTGIPAFDARYGAVEAVFTTAQRTVSIDAAILRAPESAGAPVNFPKMEIYNAAGFVTSVNWDFSVTPQPAFGGFSGYQTLSYVSGADDITKIRFLSGQPGGSPSNFGFFDNLNFEQSIVQPPPTVPEPGTIVLLSAGLLGLGVYGRRRIKE